MGSEAAPDRRSGRAVYWRRAVGLGPTELVVAAALVLLMVGTGFFKPAALSGGNLYNVLQASLPLIILALGQLVVVATAGIDLSVGSVFSLAAMVAGLTLRDTQSPLAAVLAGLATGVAFGLFNGVLVAIVQLAPFVVTLVSLSVAASLALIVTGGNSISLTDEAFRSIYGGRLLFGIPNAFVIVIALVLILQAYLAFTVPGRWTFAVGSNSRAATLIGVPVKATVIGAYVFSGAMASFAAVLTLSYLGNAEVTSGRGLELSAIAAVVIGGASLFGGRGTAIGAFIGALMITAIRNVVNLLGINTFWQGTVTGVVILVAVLADRATHAAGAAWLSRLVRRRESAATPVTDDREPSRTTSNNE